MDHSYYFASAIKNGNEKTFELFFKMEFNNILHFINAYVNDRPVAEDIAQETFITFWDKRHQIDENLHIRPYVFKIARNKTLNYIRSQHLSHTDPLKQKEYILNFQALSDEIITGKIDALQLEELISKTYNLLPPEVKKTFQLNRIQGLTYAEIASKQKVPVKAVEYQIKKALQIFRKKLKNYISLFL